MTLYLNPSDIRCFVKLPNGKAVVTTLNTADTPSQVPARCEPHAMWTDFRPDVQRVLSRCGQSADSMCGADADATLIA